MASWTTRGVRERVGASARRALGPWRRSVRRFVGVHEPDDTEERHQRCEHRLAVLEAARGELAGEVEALSARLARLEAEVGQARVAATAGRVDEVVEELLEQRAALHALAGRLDRPVTTPS